MPRPFKESLICTAAWHPDQVDAYHSSLLLQKQLLHSQKGCIAPEYVERSGNLIYIQSPPTLMRPISRFSIDWPGHPSQLIIMSVTILASLTKIHGIGSLHRNLSEESVYIDTSTSEIALLTHGDVSQRLDTSPVNSFIPRIMEKEGLANLCLNQLPVTYGLETQGKALFHPNELRQYLAIPAPERMKVSARFSVMVDLYQFGVLIYNLLTNKVPPNPFVAEYSGPEGWKRARQEVLRTLSGLGNAEGSAGGMLGPAFSEFLLRLLILSELPPYYSAYEAHSDLVGLWKASGQKISRMAAVAALPQPSQSAEKLCIQMLSTRVPFYDLQLQRVLRHAMTMLPPQLLEFLHPRSCSEVRFDFLQVGSPCLMDRVRTLDAIQRHRAMLGSIPRDMSRVVAERLISALRENGRVVSVSGKRLGGKTSLLADFITYSTAQLNACCVYVPLRGVPATLSADFVSPDVLYTSDPVLSAACDVEPGTRRCVAPLQSHQLLYIGEESLTNWGTGQRLQPASILHLVALYLAEAFSLLGFESLQRDMEAELSARYPEISSRLPSMLPQLARVLGVPASPHETFFSEDILAEVVTVMIETILRYVPLFVLVLDDLNGSENKLFLRRLWGILQSKRVGRAIVLISEDSTPVINVASLSFNQTQDPAQRQKDTGPMGVDQRACPLTARLFGIYHQGAKPASTLQLDSAGSPKPAQDDARSFLSVGSDGCQSVLSIKSTTSSMHSGASPAPQMRVQEAVAKTYTYASATRRQINTLSVVISGVTEEQAEYFLFGAVGIQASAKNMARQHQKDFVLPLHKRTMGVLGLLKRLVLTMYSYSALFPPGRYDRHALELLPGDDEMMVRRFILLKDSGRLSQRDIEVLYAASVFGQAFTTTWVADALGANHDGVFSSCTDLSSEDIHLLSYAPENCMLRHRSGGSIRQGQYASYSQSECVFMFTSSMLRRILLENFLSSYTLNLLKVGTYLRSVWLSSRLILEPQAALIPPVYLSTLGPEAISEFQKRLPEEFHAAIAMHRAQGRAAPEPLVPVTTFSLNLKAPALELAARSSFSKLFEDCQRSGGKDLLWPDTATVQAREEARSAGLRSSPFTSLLSFPSDDERYAAASQSTGLIVPLSTVCAYLNTVFPELTDIFDQLEVLRLNAYAASLYGRSASDTSQYLEFAAKAQNEVFSYMSIIFLNPEERGNYSLAFYRQLCQSRPIFSEGKNQDARKLIADELSDLFAMKTVTTGLESVAVALGIDTQALLQNRYLTKIAVLHNAVPTILASLSHSLCLFERELWAAAGREHRVASSSRLVQEGNLLHQTAWGEIGCFMHSALRLQNHPVRASFVAATFLERVLRALRESAAAEDSPLFLGFDVYGALRELRASGGLGSGQAATAGIAPGSIADTVDVFPVYDVDDVPALLETSQALILLLFDEPSLAAVRGDSALGRAYSRWKDGVSADPPPAGSFCGRAAAFDLYSIIRLIPLASAGERVVHRFLFLLYESAIARNNRNLALAVCAGAVDRMYRFGCSPEAFALAALLANARACIPDEAWGARGGGARGFEFGASNEDGPGASVGAGASHEPGGPIRESVAGRSQVHAASASQTEARGSDGVGGVDTSPPSFSVSFASQTGFCTVVPNPFKQHLMVAATTFCQILDSWARSIDADELEAPLHALSAAVAVSRFSHTRRELEPGQTATSAGLPAGWDAPHIYYDSTGRYYSSRDVSAQEAALLSLRDQHHGVPHQSMAVVLGQGGAGQALSPLTRFPIFNAHFPTLRLYSRTATLVHSVAHSTSSVHTLVSALRASLGDCGTAISRFGQASGQAFGQYAYLRLLCCSTVADYVSLAQQCQSLYNHLVSIGETTYSPLVYTVWSCSKGLSRQNFMYGESSGASNLPDFERSWRSADPEENLRAGIAAAFLSGPAGVDFARLASSGLIQGLLGIPPAGSDEDLQSFAKLTEDLQNISLSFPSFDDIVDLAEVRSDSSLIPILIIAAVLLEANARAGNLIVALSLAKTVHCLGLEVTTLGCVGAMALSRAALVLAAASSEMCASPTIGFTTQDGPQANLAEAALEHTIHAIYCSYGPYGVFSRLLEVLQGCLALHRGANSHLALRSLYPGLPSGEAFLRLEHAYAAFGSVVALAAPLCD